MSIQKQKYYSEISDLTVLLLNVFFKLLRVDRVNRRCIQGYNIA